MKKYLLKFLFLMSALLFILPILSTIGMSFWQEKLTLQPWIDLLLDTPVFYKMFWNSMFYASVITILELCVATPCAFGLVNSKIRGKKIIFMIYLILMMMPLQVTLLPNYIGLREMGLLNTRAGIIFPMIFSAFGIVVLHQYMLNLDEAQIEAARLETDSVIKILMYVVAPQMKACIIATSVFLFAECFNMLEQPMLFLKEERLQNLTVFMMNASGYEGNVLFPASVIFLIPVSILYLYFNDALEKGIKL